MKKPEWESMVHRKTKKISAVKTATSNGCLVQIHPLKLENSMVKIGTSEISIGRDESAKIRCKDFSISRKHAVVQKTGDRFIIFDCGSTNGTFVNDIEVTECELSDGCQIQVGSHIFKFLAGDSIESQYHETVYTMMTKDGLTGVFNKRYLIDALAREFERSRMYACPFSIVVGDIDCFKKFNDTYGHLAGDEVLKEFAKRIQNECGPNEIFARFGGEEFAVLLIEREKCAALKFAESIRKKIAATPFKCNAGLLEVTASFGVAEVDSTAHHNFAELLEQADKRLYEAKHAGRNCVAPVCEV